jgi:hypothetical protein
LLQSEKPVDSAICHYKTRFFVALLLRMTK